MTTKVLRILGLLIGSMFAAPALSAQDCGNRAACRAAGKKVEQKMDRIHSRMRRGYGAREGEKMQAELRRLRKERLRVCR
jgi:hypothetical protein